MVLCASGTWQVEIFAKGCHGITEHLYTLLQFSKHLVNEYVILGQDNPYVQTYFLMIMDLVGWLGPGKRKPKAIAKMTREKEIMLQTNHVQYFFFFPLFLSCHEHFLKRQKSYCHTWLSQAPRQSATEGCVSRQESAGWKPVNHWCHVPGVFKW